MGCRASERQNGTVESVMDMCTAIQLTGEGRSSIRDGVLLADAGRENVHQGRIE